MVLLGANLPASSPWAAAAAVAVLKKTPMDHTSGRFSPLVLVLQWRPTFWLEEKSKVVQLHIMAEDLLVELASTLVLASADELQMDSADLSQALAEFARSLLEPRNRPSCPLPQPPS